MRRRGPEPHDGRAGGDASAGWKLSRWRPGLSLARRPGALRWAPDSIIWRLWRGLALFLLFIAGAGALIFNGVQHENVVIESVVQRLQPLEAANLQARAEFADARASLQAYVLSGGEQRFLTFYAAYRQGMSSALAVADSLARGTAHQEVSREFRAAGAWFGYAARMEALPASDPRQARLTAQSYASASAFYLANGRLHSLLAAATRRAITEGQGSLHRAVLWSIVLAVVSLLLGIAVVVGAVRGVTRPLSRVTETLRRLTSGDHAARAPVTGSAETREVARSLNALADESDRLRAQQTESNRLRATARTVGFRIREHLRAEDVIREARVAIEENIDADVVYLQVRRGEGHMLGPPEGHEQDWAPPGSFLSGFTPASFALIDTLLRTGSSAVIQDMRTAEADPLPPRMREPLRRAGVISYLLTPFGVGSELLGIIVAERMRPDRPWTRPETDAVESIAADLGRGLHHARLYDEERKVVDELKALDRAKSDFLATVSHELRTPLTSIAGYVELLRDLEAGPLNPLQERMLSTIERNTERLRSLIEDVLTLSKIESGAFKTSVQPVELGQIASSVVTALAPAAAAKGIALSVTAPDVGLVVSGDPGQLDRALMNVVSNALKFTPGEGAVAVRVGEEDGAAVITVRDTGIGISQADQARLFTRFFRGSNAVERSIPGTGLGLAIVRTILDNHGGQILLDSEEGRGTTVTFRIPLLASRAPAARPGNGSAAGPGSWLADGPGAAGSVSR